MLKHTDGCAYAWQMNGLSVTGAAFLLNAGSGWSVAPQWSVTHTTDLDGDGKADILFQHTDGRVFIYLMNGLSITAGAELLGAGSGWSVGQIADLNGDGKADLLLKHTDGRLYMYLMNGLTVTVGTNLLGAGSGWSTAP